MKEGTISDGGPIITVVASSLDDKNSSLRCVCLRSLKSFYEKMKRINFFL